MVVQADGHIPGREVYHANGYWCALWQHGGEALLVARLGNECSEVPDAEPAVSKWLSFQQLMPEPKISKDELHDIRYWMDDLGRDYPLSAASILALCDAYEELAYPEQIFQPKHDS